MRLPRLRRRASGGRATSTRPRADERRPRSWAGIFKESAERWSSDQVSRLAASLSYYTLFSMAPLVLILIAVAGIFFGEQTARGLVTAQLRGFLGPDRARALQQMLAGVREPAARSAAGAIGLIVLVSGALSVVGELQASLNQIFGVQPVAKTFWMTIRRRLISLAFVLGLGFLMLVSLALGTGMAAAGKFFGDRLGFPPQLVQAINQSVAFVVIGVLFAGMFRFLPDARIRWRDLALGAAFTSALFTLGNFALAFYLGRAGPSSAYGAAGSLLGFMLWTYYCAQIVYFGAEFTRSYAEARGGGVRPIG